jgi:general secretion pathway protein K
VAVLLYLVLLSMIVVAFMDEAVTRIRYYGLFHQRDELRIHAYSGLETTLAVLNQYREIDGTLWGPEQGWGNPLAEADIRFPPGISVSVNIRDESGRFPVEGIDFDTLIPLFEELGLDTTRANALADAMLDWMDEDDLRRLNGFDGDDYRLRDPPYAPANRVIRSWEELDLIEGFVDNFYDEDGRPLPQRQQFIEALSLHHTGPINLNAAPPLVLATLERRGMLDTRSLQNWRYGPDGIPGTEDDRLLRDLASAGWISEGASTLDVGASMFEINVEARRGEARFLLTVLVSWTGANPSAGRTGGVQDPYGGLQTNREDGETDPPAGQPEQTATRGGSATGTGSVTTSGNAAQLGYPFQIRLLMENRRL